MHSQNAKHKSGTARKKAPKVIVIIGGKGAMGRLFAKALRSRGHQVVAIDRDDRLDPDLLKRADVVVLALPMSRVEAECQKVAKLLGPQTLLCDINSLKAKICRKMCACHRGEVMGTHPLFGPTVSSLKNQTMILCNQRTGPKSAWLVKEFRQLGLVLHHSTPSEHDHMMALVQVLVHFNKLVVAQVLCKSRFPIEKTLYFTSPIYRLELSVIGRMFAQSAQLYAAIQKENPWGNKIRAEFMRASSKIERSLRSGSTRSFIKEFENSRKYFKSFSAQALRDSDKLIEKLASLKPRKRS